MALAYRKKYDVGEPTDGNHFTLMWIAAKGVAEDMAAIDSISSPCRSGPADVVRDLQTKRVQPDYNRVAEKKSDNFVLRSSVIQKKKVARKCWLCRGTRPSLFVAQVRGCKQ